MEAGWKAAVRLEFSQRTLGESHSHWAGGGSDRTGVGQVLFSLLGSLVLLEGDFVGRSGFLACRNRCWSRWRVVHEITCSLGFTMVN